MNRFLESAFDELVELFQDFSFVVADHGAVRFHQHDVRDEPGGTSLKKILGLIATFEFHTWKVYFFDIRIVSSLLPVVSDQNELKFTFVTESEIFFIDRSQLLRYCATSASPRGRVIEHVKFRSAFELGINDFIFLSDDQLALERC